MNTIQQKDLVQKHNAEMLTLLHSTKASIKN